MIMKIDFNIKGLLSIKSVKYTTAPVIAESIIKKIRKKIKPSSTNFTVTENNSINIK